MINLFFQHGSRAVGILINNKEIVFMVNGQYTYLEGLHLDLAGIIKEFPDLKDKPDNEIKREAIKRFYEKISSLKNEEERKDYIIDDLEKYGYKFLGHQKAGFRFTPNKNATNNS